MFSVMIAEKCRLLNCLASGLKPDLENVTSSDDGFYDIEDEKTLSDDRCVGAHPPFRHF